MVPKLVVDRDNKARVILDKFWVQRQNVFRKVPNGRPIGQAGRNVPRARLFLIVREKFDDDFQRRLSREKIFP